MARYLLPVDYSHVSVNALKFALAMTGDKDQIDILHVATGIVNLAEGLMVHNLQQNEAANVQQMAEYFTGNLKIDVLPDRCLIHCETGEIVSTVTARGNSGRYHRIIMGTRDRYDILDKWLGTISLGVVKRSDIPVILVPPKAVYSKVEACVVAGDAHLTDPENLDLLATWNKELQSFLHFVHVSKGPDPEFNQTMESIITSYYEQNPVSFGFDVLKVEGTDIAGQLNQQAVQTGSGLLIVLPEKQNFFNALFLGSVSKDLILHSELPLLFLKPHLAKD